MFRKHSLLLIAALVGLLFLAGTLSFAQGLGEIQAAIKAKGQKWIADETSISVLPDNEKKLRLGLIKPKPEGKDAVFAVQEPVAELAGSVDWSSFVTPVRNQGSCGSCWAFATTAALESHLAMKSGTVPPQDNRAEQILVSCSGAGGCNGGYIGSASSFIQSTGLPAETYFGYTATDAACASAVPGWQDYTSTIGTWSYVNTTPANLTAIKNALANYGPLVTTMDVYYDFYSYKTGIYEYATGSLQGGHAVLIVGYSDDPTRADGGFFRVKNSWGTGWGEVGYFRIGYSQLSNVIGFGEWTIAYSTPVLPPPPDAPGSLSAAAVSSSQINLSWADNSSNEDGFKIERCTGAGCGNFGQVATVGAGVRAYNNSSLTPGTAYTYRVRAYNAGGDSSPTNTSGATTPPCTLSLSPTSASIGGSGGTATVAVTAGAGCAWTAKSDSSWINVTAQTAKGQGNGSFSYRVGQNRSAARTGKIAVGGQTHSVTQAKK